MKTYTKIPARKIPLLLMRPLQGLSLLAICAVNLVGPNVHADDVTADNLTVNDDAYISGNLWVNTYTDLIQVLEAHDDVIVHGAIRLGIVDGGFNNLQIDTGGDANSTNVYFTGYGADTTWYWQENSNWGTVATMTLDQNATLTLTGNSGNIVLDPNNGTILVNGTALGGGTVYVGDTGFAVGNLAVATGNRSAALGGAANASGDESIALANGQASGISALALGMNTTASVWSSVTAGHYNANITGNASTWVATDPAFIVGIGQSDMARQNGLVILNNGNTTIGGNTTLGANLTVNGTATLATANVTGNTTVGAALTVAGNSTLGGNTTTTTLNGNVTMAAPQGDIPMGQFGD